MTYPRERTAAIRLEFHREHFMRAQADFERGRCGHADLLDAFANYQEAKKSYRQFTAPAVSLAA